MVNGRQRFIKLHGTHFKIWSYGGSNISNFMMTKKRLWLNILLDPGISERKVGHDLWSKALFLQMENSNLAPTHINPDPCLLWIIHWISLSALPLGPICFWHWGSCLNLELSLLIPCLAEFLWARISESLWEVTGRRETWSDNFRLTGCGNMAENGLEQAKGS